MDNINETTMMTVLSVLGEKVQTLRAEMLSETAEQRNTIYDLEDQIQALKSKNMDLNDQLAGLSSDLDWYRKTEGEMRERAFKAESELRLFKAAFTDNKDKAAAYMMEKGQYIYQKEPHNTKLDNVHNIKTVRELTGWGLKDSKDFCEAWMRSNGFVQDPKEFFWTKKAEPIA